MNNNRISKPEETLSNLLEPPISQSSKILRFGDFYSGEGETSKLAQELGMEVVYAVEEDNSARAIYKDAVGLEPHPSVPRLFDDVPPLELVYARLSNVGVDEILRKGSPFQDVARFLRVRRPIGVIIDCPNRYPDSGLEAVLDELRSLRYLTGWGIEGEHFYALGGRRGFPNFEPNEEPLLRQLMRYWVGEMTESTGRRSLHLGEPPESRGLAAG